MDATSAAWVREYAWAPAVRAEAAHPGTVLGPCSCLRPFTCAPCAAGKTNSCREVVAFTAETVVIGLAGWAYTADGPVWVWLTDRTCVQRCHTAPVADRQPVQLDLFAVAA